MLACPDCPPALAVRAWVFGEEFWTLLSVVLVPTVLTLVAVWVIHRMLVRADEELE